VAGLEPFGKLWRLDLWRGQESSDTWLEAWRDLGTKRRPLTRVNHFHFDTGADGATPNYRICE